MEKQDIILNVVIFAAVFVLAYLFAGWVNSQNAYLFDFKIIANGKPVDALKDVFNKNTSLVLRQELTAGNSSANRAVLFVTSELIFAASTTGTKVYNYGIINGVPLNVSCTVNNSFCGAPDITVRVEEKPDACNCILVHSNHTMEIIGSTDFLTEKSANIRKIVYLARTA